MIQFKHWPEYNIYPQFEDMSHESNQQPPPIKVQEKPAEIVCEPCSKSYTKQADYEYHLKMKHDKEKEKESLPVKPRPNKLQPKNRVLEMQQNEHEDTIYSYLGELGEKNQETSSRDDLILADEGQRQSIQTNYSFNKVVRTPYQKQIKPSELIPRDWIEKTPHQQFFKTLVKELVQLEEALDAEKQKWQFRDPMAPQQQAEDEFSLMQVRKLIANYPRRGLSLKYPHFSIFVLWVGRICKPQAWEQFFMIFGYYLAEYYSRNLAGKPAERWEVYNNHFQLQPLKPYLTEKLAICDQKTVKKFGEFFNKWVQLFDLVADFC